MQKFHLLFAFIVMTMSQSIGQNADSPNGIGLYARGVNTGLLRSDGLTTTNTILAADIAYSRNILPFLNVAVPLGANIALKGDEKLLGFHGDILLQGGLFDRFRIAAPYIYAGPTFALNKNFIEDKFNDFEIAGRFGVGANFGVSENFYINLHAGYLNDFKDGNKGSVEAGLGFIYTFGGGGALSKSSLNSRKLRKSDRDGDGIPDIRDECPTVPGVAAFNGCPDTDNDGIADYEDKCPNEAGTLKAGGCPDRDGDGVADKDDKCPDIAGDPSYGGCPFFDKDKDGIPDDLDKCPDVAGLARYNGCPDTDADGVPDYMDDCPNEVGSIEANGCPDTDGDGVPDKIDKCPTRIGPASNQGCPTANQTDLDLLTSASRTLILGDKVTEVPAGANAALNKIVTLLKKNKKYTLVVYGYEDELTPDPDGSTIAAARAQAVKSYLVGKGIDAERIETVTRAKPRILNRKVSFDLK
ncbi:MAG TPA: thrombospondin type 3 repeat-containing protein [Saprospiraceae bacterium]|nr:thrombospondin type 3 repeat-containing protein [Saprospiraceae bacterium]